MLKIVKGTPEAKDVKPLKKEPPKKSAEGYTPLEELEDVEEVESGSIPKDSVRYMPAGSKCASCKHFLEPNGCDLVEGDIDPDGICMLFASSGPTVIHGSETSKPAEMPEASPSVE